MSFGLPTAEAIDVCKYRFRNEIAKVTVEIASPDVMELMKDVRVNFSDQLAMIGAYNYTRYLLGPSQCFIFRRHSRPVHRHQHH